MKKIINYFVFTILLIILFSGCDTRRNKILSNILVSPTITETVEPPTATPSPAPTEEPTPTPTPLILSENSGLLMFGDYDRADYDIRQRLSNDSADLSEILQAITDQIELHYLKDDYAQCLYTMDEITEILNETTERPRSILSKAYYISAKCSENLNQPQQQINYLEKYLEFRPDSPIISDICIDVAYAYRDLEDYDNFRQYLDLSEKYSEEPNNEYITLDYAASYSLDDHNEEAQKILAELYNNTTDENIKAAADYYLGNVFEALNQKEQTIARYQDAVNNFPKSYYSYLALLWLLDNNQTVSDFQRGLINYYIGQYSLAQESFRRYVKSEPGNDGSSWYFIGICQMNLADYDGAISSFTKLIEDYPTNRYYVSSWDELAYVQWAFQEKYKQAAETLTNYVSSHPDQPDSASFLMEAGRILERGNYLSDASKTWGRLIDEYPLYENSKTALFLAAIASYRISDYETSIALLNRLLLVSGIPEDQAQANFWIAKNYQKKNDSYNTQKYFDKTIELTHTGYYSLRAQEISNNSPYLTTSSHYDLGIDLDFERQIADQWMTISFNVDSSQLIDKSLYAEDSDYLRGCEFYSLGQFQQAINHFEQVRNKLSENAPASYIFLEDMIDKEMYTVAAYTSRQILTLAGLHEDDRTLDVPNYFNHIRFGPWYSQYLEDAAKEYNISPFILYAIMKQESMYDPWIESNAGAQGLMQIMPETGTEIAKTLHWPNNYQQSDLLRVPVSINFAASYLKRLYNYFSQSNAAMLASYNGGSGNTQKWLASAKDDPDLLYEVIRYQETKNYLHNIYRNTKIYEWLYAK